MSSHAEFTAFVPNGDSARDTAVILLSAARDAGLDESTEVVAATGEGGFYISDALADALGEDADKQEDQS